MIGGYAKRPWISFNCPKCGRFAKTIASDSRNGNHIFHCNNCNIDYGRSVNYCLEVWGEMCPHFSAIDEGSQTWNEIMESKKK